MSRAAVPCGRGLAQLVKKCQGGSPSQRSIELRVSVGWALNGLAVADVLGCCIEARPRWYNAKNHVRVHFVAAIGA